MPLVLIHLLTGCGEPAPTCDLNSTVAGFEPNCDTALMIDYNRESRLLIDGGEGALVAYLPARPEAGKYGAETGNPLTVLVSVGEREQVAESRTTWVVLGEMTEQSAEVYLHAVFEMGEVDGSLAVERRSD